MAETVLNAQVEVITSRPYLEYLLTPNALRPHVPGT